jgi:hypothetical protein
MVALRIVDATVSPSFGAIPTFANGSLGAVCMNSRISWSLMALHRAATRAGAAPFFGGADQYAHSPCVHGLEEIHLDQVAVGVVDEGDGVGASTGGGEPRAQIVESVEAP